MPRPIRIRAGLADVLLVDAWDVYSVDRRRAEAIVGCLLDEDESGDALRELVGLDEHDREVLRERAIEVLVAADVVAIRTDRRSTPIDAPRSEPLLVPDGPGGEEPVRPTWIEIEVRMDTGRPLPGHGFTMTLPDGSVRSGRLDGDSRWRLDDVRQRGACEIDFDELPAPSPGDVGARVELREDDVWLTRKTRSARNLRTAKSHRVLVLSGRTEVILLDQNEKPVEDEPVLVTLAGRRVEDRTSVHGDVVIEHPVQLTDCEIVFSNVGPTGAQHLRSEELAP